MDIVLRITDLAGWAKYRPPKNQKLQWKDEFSAKEFARAVLAKDFEEDVAQVMEKADITGLKIENAYPEYKISLDDYPGGQRNHDLACTCRSQTKKVAVCFEAKARESFGQKLSTKWNVKKKSEIRQRINSMLQLLLKRDYDPQALDLKNIYYQLLTGLVGTVKFAQKEDMPICIFVVYQLETKTTTSGIIETHKKAISRFLQLFHQPRDSEVSDNSIYGLGKFEGVETWLAYMERPEVSKEN